MPSESGPNDNTNARREWRDIQKNDFKRPTSGVARRRKWAHIGRWAGMITLALFLFGAGLFAFQSASKDANALEPTTVLEKVSFRTDGVLDDYWLSKVLNVDGGKAVSTLDLAKVRSLVEAQGQVRSATVTLRLPDELIVEIREQTPILRARAEISPTEIKTLLIAHDGIVYEGANYPVNTIRALPYIVGVMIHKTAAGYEKLPDVEPVAALLDKARVGWPRIYGDWRMVSFQRYHGPDSPVSVVEITSRSMGKIVISTSDVEDQMRRLEKLIEDGVAKGPKPVLRVDLTIQGQAIVEYEQTNSKRR